MILYLKQTVFIILTLVSVVLGILFCYGIYHILSNIQHSFQHEYAGHNLTIGLIALVCGMASYGMRTELK